MVTTSPSYTPTTQNRRRRRAIPLALVLALVLFAGWWVVSRSHDATDGPLRPLSAESLGDASELSLSWMSTAPDSLILQGLNVLRVEPPSGAAVIDTVAVTRDKKHWERTEQSLLLDASSAYRGISRWPTDDVSGSSYVKAEGATLTPDEQRTLLLVLRAPSAGDRTWVATRIEYHVGDTRYTWFSSFATRVCVPASADCGQMD